MKKRVFKNLSYDRSLGGIRGRIPLMMLLIVPLVLLAGCPVPEARPEAPIPEDPAPVVNQEPTPPITTVSSEVVEGLRLELSVPRVHFQPGKTVIATLSLVNTTQHTISFETGTSQLFDLIIQRPGRERRWSDGKKFLMVVTPRHIPPNETVSMSLAMDNIGRGEVYLVGFIVSIHARTPPLRIEIGAS